MINYLRHMNPFRQPTYQELLDHDTLTTEISLHEAHLALERAQSAVEMYTKRLARLKGQQNEHA